MGAFKYGFLGAWRNRQSTGLAVASMTLASIFLCFALVLSAGTPSQAYVAERLMAGGDIIVMPFAMAGPGGGGAGTAEMAWRPWGLETPGFYGDLFPDSFDGRLVSAKRMDGATFEHVLAGIERTTAGIPGAAVRPVYEMPVVLRVGGKAIWATVRTRDPDLDERLVLSRFISAGRPLGREDAGQPSALIDSSRLQIDTPNAADFGYDVFNGKWAYVYRGRPQIIDEPPPSVGSILTVELPRVAVLNSGTAFNYEDAVPKDVKVVGEYRLQTGEWNWISNELRAEGYRSRKSRRPPRSHGEIAVEPAVWSSPLLFVTEATFMDLAARSGWTDPRPTYWIIQLPNTLRSRDLARDLQAQWPEATVAAVADLVVQSDAAPQPMTAAPRDSPYDYHFGSAFTPPVPSPPSWLKWLVTVLAYTIGGLLFAANLWIILSRRYSEAALLRALGARRWQTFALLATEVVAVAGVGALLGWLLTLPLIALQLRGLAAGAFLGVALSFLGTVEALAFLVAFPAAIGFGLRATQVPPAEVIRHG
ncbi:MAG: FtsX-like permease family protein [Bacillota bacterium]